MLNSPLGRVRFVGMAEGASFLLLLFIAMPLKYFANIPEAVTWSGMIHGVLFLLYLLVIALAASGRQLTIAKAGLAVIASLIPFGPFIFDRWLRK